MSPTLEIVFVSTFWSGLFYLCSVFAWWSGLGTQYGCGLCLSNILAGLVWSLCVETAVGPTLRRLFIAVIIWSARRHAPLQHQALLIIALWSANSGGGQTNLAGWKRGQLCANSTLSVHSILLFVRLQPGREECLRCSYSSRVPPPLSKYWPDNTHSAFPEILLYLQLEVVNIWTGEFESIRQNPTGRLPTQVECEISAAMYPDWNGFRSSRPSAGRDGATGWQQSRWTDCVAAGIIDLADWRWHDVNVKLSVSPPSDTHQPNSRLSQFNFGSNQSGDWGKLYTLYICNWKSHVLAIPLSTLL